QLRGRRSESASRSLAEPWVGDDLAQCSAQRFGLDEDLPVAASATVVGHPVAHHVPFGLGMCGVAATVAYGYLAGAGRLEDEVEEGFEDVSDDALGGHDGSFPGQPSTAQSGQTGTLRQSMCCCTASAGR